ncbi:MAG: hypothetical protein A2X86_08080 [Bdellovibrionales bacterium GWA2_49_15]|nr:MAG: hypothetical protein A2X86_08080 [Bdellovibrionales bacterium GWA2_49_15]HAZ13272.1 hypothetical protein [Bdellovibrionales bacterium]
MMREDENQKGLSPLDHSQVIKIKKKKIGSVHPCRDYHPSFNKLIFSSADTLKKAAPFFLSYICPGLRPGYRDCHPSFDRHL